MLCSFSRMLGFVGTILFPVRAGRVRPWGVRGLVVGAVSLSAAVAQGQPAPVSSSSPEGEPAPAVTAAAADPPSPPPPPSTAVGPPFPVAPQASGPVGPTDVPPPPPAWRLQLSLTGAHSWGETTVDSTSTGDSSSTGAWEEYASRLSGTLFLGKVVDDVAGPRSLLPFLQRTTEVTAFVQAGGGSFSASSVREVVRRADTFTAAAVGASVLGYVLPALRLGARASFEQIGLSRLVEPRRFVDVGASVGLRSDDNLLSLSYDHTVAVLGGEAMPARLGALSLREYVLVDRSVGLAISGTLLDRGAAAETGVTVYPIPDLAIEGGLHAGRAAYAITDWRPVTTRVGGGGGAGFWIARVLRISAGYSATFEIIYENASELRHAVNVGLAVRL